MTRIWDQSNLHAWCVVPFDEVRRTPEQRARMLADLGITTFAYDWRDENIPQFEDELEALAGHGIGLLAWWWQDRDDDMLARTIELFDRHGVTPRLWVMQAENLYPDAAPTADDEFRARVEIEAQRIERIADAAPALGIDLYTHNDWFGEVDNQIAIIERARELGVRDVGISYNFSHARDETHDDTIDFAGLWSRAQPYVTSVNLAGTHFEDGSTLFPGDGEHDVEMMRTIESSGWRGPVGIIGESGGDARVTLATALERVRALARQLDAS